MKLKFFCPTLRFTRIWFCTFLLIDYFWSHKRILSSHSVHYQFTSPWLPSLWLISPIISGPRKPFLSFHDLHPFRCFYPLLFSSSHSLQTLSDFSSSTDLTSSEFLQYLESMRHDLAVSLAVFYIVDFLPWDTCIQIDIFLNGIF